MTIASISWQRRAGPGDGPVCSVFISTWAMVEKWWGDVWGAEKTRFGRDKEVALKK